MIHICAKCNAGVLDAPCTCTECCSKLYCDRRYDLWDGTWCRIVYSNGFWKPPVPQLKA